MTTSLELLRPGMADTLRLHAMTFPTYRRLLSLEQMIRDPADGDKRLVQPLGVVAREEERVLGLVLAEQKVDDRRWAEMLSLYVAPDTRSRGIGTALVAALEARLSSLGAETLSAVYKRGAAGAAAVERVLAKRDWAPPTVRAHMVNCTPDELSRTPWFAHLTLPEPEFQIFPWVDLTEQDRAELMRSNEVSPWIAEGLEAWHHDHYGFDPISSVGLRYRGAIVGWVINHQIAPDAVRFTCSFMRGDLSRRGRIYPLYTASILRLRDAGCKRCTWTVPVRFKEMAAFLERRCMPWMSDVSASYGSSKELSGVSKD